MLEAEVLTVGTEGVKTEYSLYHPERYLWLRVDEDGALRFDSEEPISLREYYSNDDAGSETFAQELLGIISEQASTGEVIDGRWVPDDFDDVYKVCIFAFKGQRPLAFEAGLEFNHEFRSSGVLFEVRGKTANVEEYLKRYLFEFPVEHYGTNFSVMSLVRGKKTVRVFRTRTFD